MDNRPQDKYIGMILDDRYEILEEIGAGGMAVVYKATDHRLDRLVAVKIMRDEYITHEEFRNRFCTESHAVAMLSHQNIVAIYDVSHNDDIEYIVMELIDGISLREYMDEKSVLDWTEALRFGQQVCKALSHAHERGIIHRDIKPHNIMLLSDGTVKVADFGIAALENEIHESNGQAVGSIHYIAPEQARGESPDARSDIYSLGIMFYEMLTGNLPYTGQSLAEIAVKHISAKPVPIRSISPEIPTDLERIVVKAMSPELTMRYQTAKEMLADLDSLNAVIQTSSVTPTSDADPAVTPVRSVSELSRMEYRKRRIRAGRVSFLTGSLALLLLITILFVFLWKFWLMEVFSPAERISLPNFVGQDYSSLTADDTTMAMYDFHLNYDVNPEQPEGTILSQSPEPGRSVMKSSDGIEVELTVNTAASVITIPDLSDYQYKEAILMLEDLGLKVEIENTVSETIEKNHVVSTSPEAGKSISYGSTIYLLVSAGENVATIDMPQLIGLSESAAIVKIENSGLSFESSTTVSSDLEPGTVISQNPQAFTSVEEHSKVYIQISSGS